MRRSLRNGKEQQMGRKGIEGRGWSRGTQGGRDGETKRGVV